MMGKVKAMYQDELERIQNNINDYKTSLGAIEDALTILKGVQIVELFVVRKYIEQYTILTRFNPNYKSHWIKPVLS